MDGILKDLRVSLWLLLITPFLISTGKALAETAVITTLEPPQVEAAEVKRLADQTKQEPGLDEATRTQVQTLYNQALEQLELTEQWQTKAAEYEALRLKAPELLQSLSSELKQPLRPVSPPRPDADLTELTQQLAALEAELDSAQRALSLLESEKTRRSERRIALPNLLAEAQNRLNSLTTTQEAMTAGPAALAQAQQILKRIRQAGVASEIAAYEQELRSYETRGELLDTRIELAERRVAMASGTKEVYGSALDAQRAKVADAAIQEAERQSAQVPPSLRPLAMENLQLTKHKSDLHNAIESLKQRTAEAEETLQALESGRKRIEERVAAAGLTNAIGQFLIRQRSELPSVRQLQKNSRELKQEVGAVQTRILELEDQRRALAKLDLKVTAILESLDPDMARNERLLVERKARELLNIQRKLLDSLIVEQGAYFTELVDFDVMERKLLETTRSFNRYIDENVLWIESASLLGPSDLLHAGDALVWLIQPGRWTTTLVSVWGTVRASPFLSLAFLIAALTLVGFHRRLQERLQILISDYGRQTPKSIRHSLQQLLHTLLLSATWPALLWFLSWLLASPYDSSEFAKMVAAGLQAVAVVLFAISLLRQLCRDDGIGARTFRWPKTVRKAYKTELSWLVWLLIPTVFISEAMDFQANEAFRESLGRMVFILTFSALALAAKRLFHPDRPIFRYLIQAQQQGWLFQLRYLWYGLAVGIPAGLAIAALAGYYYTAYFLSWRLVETFWLLLILVTLYALVHHWLMLKINQRKGTGTNAQRLVNTPDSTEGIPASSEEDELDNASISLQAGQMLRTAVTVGAIVGAWLIWSETLPALSILDEITLWSTQTELSETITKPDGTTAINKLVQQMPVTLADLALSLLIVVVTYTASRNIPGLLEITILAHLPFSPSAQYAITSLTKYAIVAIGVVVAFNTIGISWAKVQWLVAAMTVGLAFGLQEIFANFVSGIIILFERPIRVGDVVTVGNVSGVVSRIRIRATTITDWDRKELIVPNKRFITAEILNWTLSDAIIRVVFPVAVSRGHELEQVRSILSQIALDHPLVLSDPPPSVIFSGFAPAALRFDLRVFIRRDDYARVMDAVNTAIEEGLGKAGIEIAVERQEIQWRQPRDLPRDKETPGFLAGDDVRT